MLNHGPEPFSWPPEHIYRNELATLLLAAHYFMEDEYLENLASFLDEEIEVKDLYDVNHPVLRSRLASSSIQGGLFYEPEKRRCWIVVPSSLSRAGRSLLIHHELGHRAAGHRLREKSWLDPDMDPTGDVRVPFPTRLAVREPIQDPRACEREADHRALLARKFGRLGPRMYQRDEYFLGVVGR